MLKDNKPGSIKIQAYIEPGLLSFSKSSGIFKRQQTWFNKDPSIYWFDFETDTGKILKKIEDVI